MPPGIHKNTPKHSPETQKRHDRTTGNPSLKTCLETPEEDRCDETHWEGHRGPEAVRRKERDHRTGEHDNHAPDARPNPLRVNTVVLKVLIDDAEFAGKEPWRNVKRAPGRKERSSPAWVG